MMLVILIRGLRNVRKSFKYALKQLSLTRRYHAVLVEESPQLNSTLHKVRPWVAWGPATEETVKKLEAKGPSPYALHAPVKGFGAVKKRYPEGAYGNWDKEVNTLVKRMM